MISRLFGAFGLYQLAELQQLGYHVLGQLLLRVPRLMKAFFEQSNPLERVTVSLLLSSACQGLELGLEEPAACPQASPLCLRRQEHVFSHVLDLRSRRLLELH